MQLNEGSAQARAADHRRTAAAADPALVWHYTDGPGLISILSGHCLWATAAPFLNDQQEVALGIDRLMSAAGRFAVDERAKAEIADAIDPRRVSGTTPTSFFILSASRSWDSLAMWRLYGGAAESYAIGLDPRAKLGVLGPGIDLDDATLGRSGVYLKRQPWERVRYSDAEQRALVDGVLEDLPRDVGDVKQAMHSYAQGLDAWQEVPEQVRVILRRILDGLEQAVLLTKHPGFEDEREVRHSVVLLTDRRRSESADLAARLLSYRATGYGIAPYLRLTGGAGEDAVVSQPQHLPIRAVAISPSPNGLVAEASVSNLLDANGYHDVPVLRSAIPFRS